MNEKTKVQVQGVPETMLQTLYARAQESKKPSTGSSRCPGAENM